MEDYIAISALQHYVFCPRQCSLIWMENKWEDNMFTVQGTLFHKRVDSGIADIRCNKNYKRNVHVCSSSYKIHGVIDLVEESRNKDILIPVEYKRGKSKKQNICDEIQLCAQALCLEEMTGKKINNGAIWYCSEKHRITIDISNDLIELTLKTIDSVRKMLRSDVLPKPKYEKKCNSCSLSEICQPELVQNDNSKKYVKTLFLGDCNEKT